MGVGAAILGAGALGAGASLFGSSQQAGAASDATAAQMQMYQQTRSDLAPYMQAGQGALNNLMNYWGIGQPSTNQLNPTGGGGVGTGVVGQGGGLTAGSAAGAFNQLQNYPGYQFQYGQGLEALNRNLAAGGRYQSGAMMKDAQAYGQGFAQNSVNQYLDMLKFISNAGQTSAAGVGQAGVTTGQGVAQNMMAGGTASAAGTVGAGNALTNAIQGYAIQNQLGGGGFATYSPTGGWTPGPQGFPG